jgi:hypothetical protein
MSMTYAELTEAYLGRGDLIDALNAHEEMLASAIDELDSTIERIKDRCTQMRFWGVEGRSAAVFIENAIEAKS